MASGRPLKTNRIPIDWDDVSPAWMTAAIAGHHPGATVADVRIITRDDGSNRRARFGLTYSAGSGPETVFLKAHAANHRWVHFRNGNLFNEARLFASGAMLPLDHPTVYRSMIEYLRLDFLLVMEDLTQRGADPRDATRPMTVEQVASGLRGLAKLHSAYWGINRKTHPHLGWIKTWKPAQGWLVGLAKRIPTGLERGAGILPGPIASLGTAGILDFWVRYVGTLSKGPVTMTHGDAHIGNTYVLPGGEVGFLDWQVVRRGNWSQDVGHFLISSLTEADRRASEAKLIEVYRQALEVPVNQLPTAQQAWLAYRSSAAYGLAIWLSTLGTDTYQSREISTALAGRFASAFLELDSSQALREIGA